MLLLPVEIEIKHTEKERDDNGNETSTVVAPGKNTLLRDEIADLRIKIPTVSGADWELKLDLDTSAMKTETLSTRGSVQMYDFGKVDDESGAVTSLTTDANNTTKAGPYDIKLRQSKGGEETFKVVVNKEGKFKLRIKSADNKIDVTSQEFTVTKRIRKYAHSTSGGTLDYDKHDKSFESAAAAWGTFYGNAVSSDVLKAIGYRESQLGYQANEHVDIMSVGNPGDHILDILRKENGFKELEAVPGGSDGWTIRYLDYDAADKTPASTAIYWATCWLYHKAQKGKMVSDANNPPHYVRFAGWNSWETAVSFYGPNTAYLGLVEGPWKKGVNSEGSVQMYLWPVLTNQKSRK